jgi:hypothetical protein
VRRPSTRQHGAVLSTRTPLRDTVRIGKRQQSSRFVFMHGLIPPNAKQLTQPPILLTHTAQRLAIYIRHAPAVLGNDCHARPEIDVTIRALAGNHVALVEQRRDDARGRSHAQPTRGEKHVSQARMYTERRHGAAMRGDAMRIIHRAQLAQKDSRFRERAGGRSIEPPELPWIVDTRDCEVERKRCEVRLQNIRSRVLEQVPILLEWPQAIGDTGRRPSRAASALVRRRARHADRLEPRHPGTRSESRHARQATIHDDPNSLDGEARFGDRC